MGGALETSHPSSLQLGVREFRYTFGLLPATGKRADTRTSLLMNFVVNQNLRRLLTIALYLCYHETKTLRVIDVTIVNNPRLGSNIKCNSLWKVFHFIINLWFIFSEDKQSLLKWFFFQGRLLSIMKIIIKTKIKI